MAQAIVPFFRPDRVGSTNALHSLLFSPVHVIVLTVTKLDKEDEM